MTDKCCHKVYICSNSNHWQEHIHFLRKYYYDTLIYIAMKNQKEVHYLYFAANCK
jgi:hypothetical protein